MPELPEVQTTVMGLRRHIIGLRIKDVWSDYNSPYFLGSETIKDPKYFTYFRKHVPGKTVLSIERRAKNILINLTGGLTVLIHMKMTGHLLYGRYHFNPDKKKHPWEPIEPESLKDPFNSFIHFAMIFNNSRQLAFSDMRKFGKVTLADTKDIHESVHLKGIGPEPLEKAFTFDKFSARIDIRPRGKIKQVLMDQKIIAGIGNIYADESLWRAGIHPASQVMNITLPLRRNLFSAIKKTLSRGIDFGGDSMSDYRNVLGEKGSFQEQHNVYQKKGEKCGKKGCGGIIARIVIGGRGTHFCPIHQKLFIEHSKKHNSRGNRHIQ